MQITNAKLKPTSVALIIALLIIAPVHAQTLSPVAPASVGMSESRLRRIDSTIEEAIKRRETPGAVVLVGRKGKVVYRKAYGNRSLVPSRETMTIDTIFDLASLTKVVATTTSIMLLVERGQLRLSDSITKHIPELKNNEREPITIEDLLTHTSGYAPDFNLREQWTGNDEALRRLYVEPLRAKAGERFVYSDIGFIALGEIVRRASGKSLDEFAGENIFAPLQMRDTNFRSFNQTEHRTSEISNLKSEISNNQNTARIAPTETARATATYLGGTGDAKNSDVMLRGIVHDPTAQRMNGVAGHAGLFSTVDDLARFCQMLLNGGTYNSTRVLSPLTIAAMIEPHVIADSGAARGLGWDMASAFSSNRGELFPLGSFGHTGFTGTSIWIDPASETFVVFLSNRVHPDGKGDVSALRARVATIVASSITDDTRERAERQEANFKSNVGRQIAARLARRIVVNNEVNNEVRNDNDAMNADVLNGIDVLERNGFKELQNLRVGLVTNHTGRNRAGKPTIDILRGAENVKLVKLFAPEHGIRGALDEKVSDSTDDKTGLPIYSLYGETRRPKPEHLQDLDAIVFDIQDIGSRFYTYISTLGNVMEEAAKRKIPVFVLDRPNPINGVDIEGAIADADKLSFTAYHTIPVRHGMTIGELATLFNRERKINADLRVIKMQNWQRPMWFDQTNQTWVNPSPNMRSLTQATLYPGIGLLETTNLSVGRGTDTPFEIIGAPYIDGIRLAKELNALSLPGVRFVPVNFTPRASVFKDETCGGINNIITDRAQFRPVTIGIEIARALRALYPTEWKVDSYLRLLANTQTLEAVKRGQTTMEIVRAWQSALDDFKTKRAGVLLY